MEGKSSSIYLYTCYFSLDLFHCDLIPLYFQKYCIYIVNYSLFLFALTFWFRFTFVRKLKETYSSSLRAKRKSKKLVSDLKEKSTLLDQMLVNLKRFLFIRLCPPTSSRGFSNRRLRLNLTARLGGRWLFPPT